MAMAESQGAESEGVQSSLRIVAADAVLAETHLADLVDLLRDGVAGGASIGWVRVPDRAEAEAWWAGIVGAVTTGACTLLLALDGARVVGTVQVHPSPKENQRHRGDIAKLLVHSTSRGRGIGRALMAAAEEAARDQGLSLLTLDTRAGDPSEHLYRRLGWTVLGTIPGYATGTTGAREACIFFFKQIGP